MLVVGILALGFFEAMLITRKQWFLSFLNAITPTTKDLTKEELSFGGFAAINILLVVMAGLASFMSKVIYDYKTLLYSLYVKMLPIMTWLLYVALAITGLLLIKYALYRIYKSNKPKAK